MTLKISWWRKETSRQIIFYKYNYYLCFCLIMIINIINFIHKLIQTPNKNPKTHRTNISNNDNDNQYRFIVFLPLFSHFLLLLLYTHCDSSPFSAKILPPKAHFWSKIVFYVITIMITILILFVFASSYLILINLLFL